MITSFSQIKGLLTRLDSVGNVLWHQRYPGVLEIWHMELMPDDGVLLSGKQDLAIGGGTGSDIILIRTDSLGNELWRHVFDNPEDEVIDNESPGPIVVKEDGTIIIISSDLGIDGFSSNAGGPWDVKRIEDLGEDGFNILEDYHIEWADTEKWPWEMVRLANGNIACMGQNGQYFSAADAPAEGIWPFYGYLRVMSPYLDSLYSRWYSYFSHFNTSPQPLEYIEDLAECPDGGFALAGTSWANPPDINAYVQHAWMLKTDSLGCIEPGCHLVSGLREQVMGLDGSMTVFPNPVSSAHPLHIRFSPLGTAQMPYANEQTKVVVYDQFGRLVFEQSVAPTGSNQGFLMSIAPGHLASGTYILHWMNEKGAWYDSVQLVVE